MSPRLVNRSLFVVCVLVLAGSVWLIGESQRDSVSDTYRRARAAEQMLIGVLDQETALRGYRLTRDESFLEQYEDGGRRVHRVMGRPAG